MPGHRKKSATSENRRAVSGTMLVALVVGDVLGAGIYSLVGEVGARMGRHLDRVRAGAAARLFTACAYAELSLSGDGTGLQNDESPAFAGLSRCAQGDSNSHDP
jgi:hypothetical protein